MNALKTKLIRDGIIASFLALCLFVAPAVAQETYGETIEVNEVLLDVQVLDKKGQLVMGLDKDDFIVREDGEPVELRNVAFYSNFPYVGSEETARELGITETEPDNRYFVLFFHHQHRLLPRLTANLLDAGRRAKQWVRSELRPNDFVAVASYDPKLNIQDFSNEPEFIAAAIDEAVQRKDFSVKETADTSNVPSIVEHVPAGDADQIYEALAMTAEAVGEVRGRKNLVLFSIGFGEVGAFGFYRPDPRYYPDMIETLNDNNVAVYSVDLLASDLSPFFLINQLDNVLSAMAHETDGEFFYSFTNYLTPLEQIAETNTGYYLLSYRQPQDAETGEYQEVEVDTLNSNFKVRVRDGYVPGDGYPYRDAPDAGT